MKKYMLLVALSSVSITVKSAEKIDRRLKYESSSIVLPAPTLKLIDKESKYEQMYLECRAGRVTFEDVRPWAEFLEKLERATRNGNDMQLSTYCEACQVVVNDTLADLLNEYKKSSGQYAVPLENELRKLVHIRERINENLHASSFAKKPVPPNIVASEGTLKAIMDWQRNSAAWCSYRVLLGKHYAQLAGNAPATLRT